MIFLLCSMHIAEDAVKLAVTDNQASMELRLLSTKTAGAYVQPCGCGWQMAGQSPWYWALARIGARGWHAHCEPHLHADALHPAA